MLSKDKARDALVDIVIIILAAIAFWMFIGVVLLLIYFFLPTIITLGVLMAAGLGYVSYCAVYGK